MPYPSNIDNLWSKDRRSADRRSADRRSQQRRTSERAEPGRRTADRRGAERRRDERLPLPGARVTMYAQYSAESHEGTMTATCTPWDISEYGTCLVFDHNQQPLPEIPANITIKHLNLQAEIQVNAKLAWSSHSNGTTYAGFKFASPLDLKNTFFKNLFSRSNGYGEKKVLPDLLSQVDGLKEMASRKRG